jgi:alanine dehydrogenase
MPPLSENDIQRLLDPAALIAAIETAFRDRYPTIVIPPRSHIATAAGIFLAMPCYDRRGNALGIKLVMVQQHPARPAERVQATYMLLSPETGGPVLTLPAKHLTDLRTAAMSAVATKVLARADVRTLGIFGIGRQARAHARLIALVRRFEKILVCGRQRGDGQAFAEKISAGLNVPAEAVDAAACAQADVVCTCTTSSVPLFDGKLLRPGTHLNAVGAFQPHTRELDTATVSRSRVVVDTYDGALSEAGDLLLPIEEGAISREYIGCDLHELVSGKKRVRRDAGQITLFKSVGCALADLVAAEVIHAALT